MHVSGGGNSVYVYREIKMLSPMKTLLAFRLFANCLLPPVAKAVSRPGVGQGKAERIGLLVMFVLVVLLAGSASATQFPRGDLTRNGIVNFEDFSILAKDWLEPVLCYDSNCPNLDRLNIVNRIDLEIFINDWGKSGIPLVINEFMAINSDTIEDPEEADEYPDWIEIYNAGDYSIDIGGMYLTDDPCDPGDWWQIPTDSNTETTIAPHGHLVIWADSDPEQGVLHTDFKLSGDGEDIALFDSNSILIDRYSFNQQYSDISYGRLPDTSDNWRFMGDPTPGLQNDGGYLGLVEEVKFSHKRGIYTSSFSLILSTETDDATIRYTTDGREPTESSTEYTSPLYISSTNCIRARAFRPGWLASRSKTHSYLFGLTTAQKSLPIISIVGDEEQSLIEPNGVMAIVGGEYNGGVWQAVDPCDYNNPIHRGIEYERPISVELIEPYDSNVGFQENCGIRVQGSDYHRPRYRRDNPDWSQNWNYNKFSFKCYFRSDYGENRLEYPMFPLSDISRWRSVVLRGGHNDMYNPFVKDELHRRLHRDMGAVEGTGIIANLILNGEFKIFYNPCERTDQEFFQEWYDSDEEWDVITQSEARDGDYVAWNALNSFITGNDMSNNLNYYLAGKRFDIQAFIDYLLVELYSANWDWPGNNWTVAAERSDKGKFRYLVWDIEGAMQEEYLDDVGFNKFPSYGGNSGLNGENTPMANIYRALRAHADFDQLFSDRLHKHFNNGGAMTKGNILARFNELKDEMSAVLPSMYTYIPVTWIPQREAILLDACADEDLFLLEAPAFYINDVNQHGGYISVGDDLSIIKSGSGTIYYTIDGQDPRLWGSYTSLVDEHADKQVLVPTGDIGTDWRTDPNFITSGWTEGEGGVGYETGSGYESYIDVDVYDKMYNHNGTCYLRIPFTVDCDPADITTLILQVRYDDGFIAYLNGVKIAEINAPGSPQWNSLATGSHEADDSFDSYDVTSYIGNLDKGENLLAIHALNRATNNSDFIICAELLKGSTLGGISASASSYTSAITMNESATVKARVLYSGDWSGLNEATYAVGPVAENLRITEIMFHPQDVPAGDPNAEYIELRNIGPENIKLNLVRFTKGVDFTFPPGINLAAGDYIVVVKDKFAFASEYPSFTGIIAGEYEGSLNNGGEKIRLRDAVDGIIHEFNYGDDWRPITDGEGFSLTIIDQNNPDPNSWGEKDSWRASALRGGSPGTDDDGLLPNPGTIAINEVMSHSHGTAPDWIELFNTTAEGIDIGGWYLSDNDDDDPNRMKYKVAAGTVIPAGGYMLFCEDANFGATASDPGRLIGFAFSENGEEVCLSSAQGAELTGYREIEDFGASETGISFGRYFKSSTGNYNFVALDSNTPGAANAYPKISPIVITEIMYNPPTANQHEEYIELYNRTASSVVLYDYVEGLPWKFTSGIDYTFPDSPNEVTLGPGEYLLLVKDPYDFALRYSGVPGGVQILGPYDGKLNNDGEKLDLSKPGDVDEFNNRYYILLERVNYSDGSHPQDCPGNVDLWPVEPDGFGASLSRLVAQDYANDPNNWGIEDPPTPGE